MSLRDTSAPSPCSQRQGCFFIRIVTRVYNPQGIIAGVVLVQFRDLCAREGPYTLHTCLPDPPPPHPGGQVISHQGTHTTLGIVLGSVQQSMHSGKSIYAPPVHLKMCPHLPTTHLPGGRGTHLMRSRKASMEVGGLASSFSSLMPSLKDLSPGWMDTTRTIPRMMAKKVVLK